MIVLLALLAGSPATPGADPCPPASAAVAAGGCGDFLLMTSGTDAGLWLCMRGAPPALLSDSPGAGRNALVLDGDVYFKECGGGTASICVWHDGEVRRLLEGEGLCGPFPARGGVMASEGGDIILLTGGTEPGARRETGAGRIPSACRSGDWLVLVDGDGDLLRIPIGAGAPEPMGLDRCATVSERDGLVLVRHTDGTFSVVGVDGRALVDRRPGLWPGWSSTGDVVCGTADGAVMVTDPATGETLLDRTGGAFRPVDVPGWGLCWTEATSGRLFPGTALEDMLALPEETRSGPRPPAAPSAEIDVPWLHQRWDTPDWFDGSWSCGPSSCTMAVQYYDRLTPDSIWCSSPPPGHWSRWGRYIPEEFTFLGCTYDILGVSPGDVWVPGAHGFICRDAGGAYWAYMALFMQQAGLESDWAGTAWSTLTSELQNSWPVVCSSTIYYGSGTYGHIILFAGYYEDHTVIVNDPYGDANDPGWGGSSQYPDGKAVLYDWPGYNNGHLEIGAVNQLFTARHAVPVQPDTLVDDLSLGFEKLGPCQYWHEQATGYAGGFWWTYTTDAAADTNSARWHPVLPWAGYYEVSVFVPPDHAEGTGIYRLSTPYGTEQVALDQSQYSGEWAPLGGFYLQPGDSLCLGDGNTAPGEQLAFDAALFSFLPGGVEPGPGAGAGMVVSPNPCRGTIRVLLEDTGGDREILLVDIAGRVLQRMRAAAGTTEVMIGKDLPSGTYLLRMMPSGESCKALVLI